MYITIILIIGLLTLGDVLEYTILHFSLLFGNICHWASTVQAKLCIHRHLELFANSNCSMHNIIQNGAIIIFMMPYA